MGTCATCAHWDGDYCKRAEDFDAPFGAAPVGYENSRVYTSATFGCNEHKAR